MSAFMLSDNHLNALLSFLKKNTRHAQWTKDDLSRYGNVLKHQNNRSVNFRYKTEDKCSEFILKDVVSPSAVQVLKYCACYDYQACETDDYKNTEAFEIIQKIRSIAIDKLPGYGEAEWALV